MFLYIVSKEESNDADGGLTDSYHNGGGLVIVANQAEHALEMIAAHNEQVWHGKILNVDKDVLLSGYYTVVSTQEPRLWFFPNAGCCG